MENKYFSAKVNHISNWPELQHGNNKQLMYALDTINKAICQNKKISFVYNEYSSDFKLHPKQKERYVVNPCQMVINNGFYYLIGNYDRYDDISHYRLNKMTCVEMLEEKAKSQNKVIKSKQGLNLSQHMAEHVYMFGGESIVINLLVDEKIISELVDWFGSSFSIMDKKDNEQILVRIKCNEQAFFYWALQYGMYVEVVEPVSLRNKLAEAVRSMDEKYNK